MHVRSVVTKGRRLTRFLATATAVALLTGQLLAAGHFHQTSADTSLGPRAVAVLDGICAVCLFHSHAPAAAHALPKLVAPAISRTPIFSADLLGPLSRYVLTQRGRSPPCSL